MIKDNIKRKTLSIRISTNGFCFCGYTPTIPDSLQHYTFVPDKERSLAANFNKAIEEVPFIQSGEHYTVKAIIESTEYTCLPNEYDNREEYKQYYNLCFPKSNSNIEIVSNKLNAQGFTIIFPVEQHLYEEIQKLGEITYYTPASIIAGFIYNQDFEESQYMLAYIQSNKALFVSVKDKKIELINSFKANQGQDTLFYLLSIWKEQCLSQAEDTLYLCGDRSIEEILLTTGKFIKSIKRLNPHTIFPSNLLNKIEGIPFDLQALILCE